MLQDAPLSHRLRVQSDSLSDEVDVEYGEGTPAKDDGHLVPTLELRKTAPSPSGADGKHGGGRQKKKRTKPSPPAPAMAVSGASKILFLDGLRGLAAMLVIVQHVGYMGVPMGQPAVDTFFVLSAFLLTMIFEKKARTLFTEKANWRRWGWALLDYFARRFLRVYPLFTVVAIYLTVYSPEQKEKLFRVHHPEEYNILKVLTFEFKYRYHVFWTLPLEVTYYFIIPVFVIILLKLHKFWFVPMLPLTYLVMYSGFYWFRLDHMPLKPHLPTFLCGSMAAMVYAKTDQWISQRAFVFRWYHTLLLRTVEMLSLVLLLSTVFHGLLFDWVAKNPVPQTPGGHFVSATVSVIVVCEMLQRGAISSVLEWSLLRYAGKISFSMYLLHSFVIYSDWVKRQQSYWNKFFAVWGLTFLLATVSYHAIESPSQWLAGRVGSAIKKRDAAERLRADNALPVTANQTQRD